MTEARRGFLLGLAAYALWGIFPLYWRLIGLDSAVELLGHRILWSAVAMLALVLLLQRRRRVRQVVRSSRQRRLLWAAATLISVNWGIFIWGVNNDRVVETSLGYFMNPLVTVLAGVLLLGERLRRVQWVAIALAGVAVLGLTVENGRPPWVALGLAFSFAAYGVVKKQVNAGAIEGLAIETWMVVPVAAAYLAWLSGTGRAGAEFADPWQLVLLVSTGVVTALPLLCFGAAATRIPLTTLGLLQYVAPSMHFLLGVYVFGEPMSTTRWIGFLVIWVALVLYTADSLQHRRQLRLRTVSAV